MIATPIALFLPGKSSTVSYSDSCFIVVEVLHVFFWVYHMWGGIGIHNECFTVMLLVWCFHDKEFIVDYVFCDVVCIFFFRLLPLLATIFFLIFHFAIISFILVILFLVVIQCLFPEYLPTVFLDIFGYFKVMAFWYVFNFFMVGVFSLVTVSSASCTGTLVLIFYIKGLFIFSWSSWFWLFVHSVKFHQKIVTNPLNS